MDAFVHITSVHIYPVKSLGPISLNSSFFAKRGLKKDRRWMLLDANDSMVTQRTRPELSHCKLAVSGEKLEITAGNGEGAFLPTALESGHRVNTKIWDDEIELTVYHGPANELLSQFLGEAVRFVYQMDEQIRKTDPRYSQSGDMVSLADAFPILVTNQKSLDNLNAKLEFPIGMDRFRPNIVVDGDLEPFEEDDWSGLENDEISWRVAKACGRCSMTTINKEAKFEKEPLKTLSTFRKFGSKVNFGMNVISDHSGEIKVGDKLKVFRNIVASDHE